MFRYFSEKNIVVSPIQTNKTRPTVYSQDNSSVKLQSGA